MIAIQVSAIVLASALSMIPQAATPPNANPADARPRTPPPASPTLAPPVVVSGRNVDELPPIEMIPPVLDMGIALPKAGMKGTVQLKNTSDKPIKILLVTPSCKCTTTNDLANKVIPPGESIDLEAHLEPVSMPQKQKAMVKILVEGYGKILELPVSGEVANAIRANPPLINAVQGQPQNGRIVIESVDRQPFRICAIGGRKPEYIGFNPASDEPRNTYLVKYDLDTWKPVAPAYLIVETDRPECPTFDVWVRNEANIPRPGFKMKEYRVNASRMDIGGTAEVVVGMEDDGDEIFAVESGSPEVDVKLKKQEADGKERKLTLAVTPKNPQGGLFYSSFKIYSRGKDQSLIVFGTARPKDSKGCTGCVAVDPPPPSPAAAAAAQSGAATPTAPVRHEH